MGKHEEFKLLTENFNKWLKEEDKQDVNPELLSRAQELVDLSGKLISTAKDYFNRDLRDFDPGGEFVGDMSHSATRPSKTTGDMWVVDLYYLVKDKYNRIKAGKFDAPPEREEKNYELIKQKMGSSLGHFFKSMSQAISRRLKVFKAVGGLYNMLSAANPFRKLLGESLPAEALLERVSGPLIQAIPHGQRTPEEEAAAEERRRKGKEEEEAEEAAKAEKIAKELEEFPFGFRNQYQIIREMLTVVRDPIFDDVYMKDLEDLILVLKTEYEENYSSLMRGGL